MLRAVCLLIVRSFTENKSENPQNMEINNWNYLILIVTNIASKGFGNASIPPIYQQLKQRNLRTMHFIIVVSWLIATVIYLVFGVCGYYLFGKSSNGYILNNFDVDDVWFIVARLGMCVSIK